MIFGDDLVADRQSHPSCLTDRLGGEKWIEDLILYGTHLTSQEGAASRFSISLTKQRLILVVP